MSNNTQLDMFEQVDGKIYIREPRGLFVLVHFPNSWDMVDGEWLPQLTEVPVVPGVNYVGGTVDNEDLSQFREWLDRKDATYINPADKRLGEFYGFLRKRGDLFKITEYSGFTPKCSHHYLGCGITDEVYKVVNGKYTLTYRTDGQRYNEFRKLLARTGIVKPITNECIERLSELKQTVNDRLAMSGRKVEDEQSPPFYNMNYLAAWLDKQKNIIANEQRFFDMLIRNGYTEAACIYTLHMSNPPPLEEVMSITGLGKTTIYNKLKTLRATEKVALDITFNPISDEAFHAAKNQTK